MEYLEGEQLEVCVTPKTWSAILIGLGVTVLTFVILRAFSDDFLRVRDGGNFRLSLVWMVILGFGIGGAALAGVRYHPLVAAVPAVLLLALYVPVFKDLMAPSWYPEWVRAGVLPAFSPVPFTIIGVLGFSSLWSAWNRWRD
ncbi:MAG: hypothetical protein KJ698_09100 [Actinobacteria bacterium]|nr:hypothetical protein [Actinomycetota bacterium]MBU1494421.1 hypothetical protein [Actinomycetota bacterium]